MIGSVVAKEIDESIEFRPSTRSGLAETSNGVRPAADVSLSR